MFSRSLAHCRRIGHASVRVNRCFVSTITLALAAFAWPALSAAQAATNLPQTVGTLTRVGSSTIHTLPTGSGNVQDPEIDTTALDDGPGLKVNAPNAASISASASNVSRRANLRIPSKTAGVIRAATTARTSSLPLPEPVAHASFVVPFQGFDFLGFNGLSHVDQRTANGGNQYSLEPPDQGLCVGRGFVVETVNTIIRVYDTGGNAVTGVEDLNTFFGLAPAVDRTVTPAVPGPFLADPRCYYDSDTQRWFVSILMQDSGGNPGATGRNYNLLAVSQTPDPRGAFTIFGYDVTDDGLNGTPNHPGCPCFGDQPLLGADHFGMYQTTNEFSATGFNGAQIYAFSKQGIVEAAESSTAPVPVLVRIDAAQALVPYGGESYSIQPATSPAGEYDLDSHGTEFFLSALQFGNPGYEVYDNRIAVWAMTNTRSLSSSTPAVSLRFKVISSETYGQPDPATQKAGETPLADALGDSILEQLNTNDDRMNQVVYANGILYSGVNSKLSVAGASQTGIAWFAVHPSVQGTNLNGSVVQQGYVAVKGNNVLFPSVGVSARGQGVIAFSLSGPDYFPSAAYADFAFGFALPVVHIAGAGQDPEDGFTGYPQYGGNGVARWGDYSAAVADGNGRVWFASEYIPNACSTLTLPCRTSLANWGSFIASVNPF